MADELAHESNIRAAAWPRPRRLSATECAIVGIETAKVDHA